MEACWTFIILSLSRSGGGRTLIIYESQNLTVFPSGRGHVQNDDLVAGQFQEALNALL